MPPQHCQRPPQGRYRFRTKNGFSRITLIAESLSLAKFYSTLGFVAEGRMTFFGHRYTRMAIIILL